MSIEKKTAVRRGGAGGVDEKVSVGNRVASLFSFLLLAVVVFVSTVGCANLPPSTGPSDPVHLSTYVEMPDGVRLAVEAWIPPEYRNGISVPAVVVFTRYWRYIDSAFGSFDPQERDVFLEHGYAYVSVDVRGTGASFGSWEGPWSPTEIDDCVRIIDWIAERAWCNGAVATYGYSYSGTIQLLIAARAPSALKAICPMRCFFDVYRDLVFPGGVLNRTFLTTWMELNRHLDANDDDIFGFFDLLVRGVMPVDGRKDVLQEALEQHRTNLSDPEFLSRIEYRDTVLSDFPFTLDELSPHVYADLIERSEIPIMYRDGWFDGGGAMGALTAFETLENDMRVVIGPWAHMSTRNEELFPRGGNGPGQSDVLCAVTFFDRYVKDETVRPDMSVDTQATRCGDAWMTGEIEYYVLGAKEWRTAGSWPPEVAEDTVWYLGGSGSDGNGVLTDTPPTIPIGCDEYVVRFDAAAGDVDRYNHLGGQRFGRVDRSKENENLLTYTSGPMESETEITGNPRIGIYLRTSADAGAVFAYLEAVSPRGRVTLLTQGILELRHRAVQDPPLPYAVFGPRHTFEEADALSVVPGDTMYVEITMNPISVVLPPGYRIRLSLAGHDGTSFPRIPEDGSPVWQVGRNAAEPSMLVVPMVPATAGGASR